MAVMLSSLRRRLGDAIFRQVGRARAQIQRTRVLPVDVVETTDTYLLVFDAPGSDPEDVQVRYLDGTIRFSIDRTCPSSDGYELRYGGRARNLGGETTLPTDAVVDAEAATARLTDAGTVTIELPKDGQPGTEKRDPEEIAIDD